MDTAAAKQQIVERLKQANNVLVTVSSNPSVDQLAACIGVTLFLNKLNKHATAVFSGEVPSTLEFLQPEKTIETNTDSLRDFIISLDKAKADKLRYKVEDKFVRIYITPYRTSLSEKDLVFSEGDFNVEVVLALGVRDKNQLDAAITQHGRILHDATVISVNSGVDKVPAIGQINWQEQTASSLCEMLVSISEAFGTGLIDNQMATAFLTGIVAETKRFSNPKTSPKVMTMAAQLMAAGANQQLIVSKLEPPAPPPEAERPVEPPKTPPKPPSDTLNISHGQGEQDSPEVEVKPGEIHIDKYGNIVTSEDINAAATSISNQSSPEQAKAHASMPQVAQQPLPGAETPDVPEPPVPVDVKPELPESPQPVDVKPELPETPQHERVVEPPSSEPEARTEVKPHELLDPANHKPSLSPPFSADTEPGGVNSENASAVDPLGEKTDPRDVILGHSTFDNPATTAAEPVGLSSESTTYPEPDPVGTPTLPTPNADNARSAVNNAISAAPFDPANHPVQSLNAQPMGNDLKPTPAPPVPPPLPRQATYQPR